VNSVIIFDRCVLSALQRYQLIFHVNGIQLFDQTDRVFRKLTSLSAVPCTDMVGGSFLSIVENIMDGSGLPKDPAGQWIPLLSHFSVAVWSLQQN